MVNLATKRRFLAFTWVLAGLHLPVADAGAAPPWNSRDDLICRGASAVGYSYYWGGSCWCRNSCTPNLGGCGAGSCSGNCPSCTHSGSYGADCSGLINKVWQVPNPIATTTCGHGPYVANSFRSNHAYWNVISRSNVQRGDALASSSHVVLFHYGDPWGSMVVHEARGCSYGVVHNWRTCSSSYSAARRINISDCACTPGQSDSQGCGNCGYRTRTCGSNCQWSGWSGCQGQGSCRPGASATEACCDCGTRTRQCNSGCQWGAWSGCAGPDPNGGSQGCDTGQPGPCAAGVTRCVGGCLQCDRVQDPEPELCDGQDNDCDGVTDNGPPTELGTSPPPFAARILDYTYPRRVSAGQVGSGWVVFENVGTESWQTGRVWLAVAGALGTASQLHDPTGWPAHDVLAVNPHPVAPGQTVTLGFSLSTSADQPVEITERFTLLTPSGEPVACPSPTLEVTLGVSQRPTEAPQSAPSSPTPTSSGESSPTKSWSNSSGCQSALGASDPAMLLWLLLAGLWMRLRRGRRA